VKDLTIGRVTKACNENQARLHDQQRVLKAPGFFLGSVCSILSVQHWEPIQAKPWSVSDEGMVEVVGEWARVEGCGSWKWTRTESLTVEKEGWLKEKRLQEWCILGLIN